jgi:hypothetical protein
VILPGSTPDFGSETEVSEQFPLKNSNFVAREPKVRWREIARLAS